MFSNIMFWIFIIYDPYLTFNIYLIMIFVRLCAIRIIVILFVLMVLSNFIEKIIFVGKVNLFISLIYISLVD
jgi:hypothetical protein